MYQPALRPDQIKALYYLKKKLSRPMTELARDAPMTTCASSAAHRRSYRRSNGRIASSAPIQPISCALEQVQRAADRSTETNGLGPLPS